MTGEQENPFHKKKNFIFIQQIWILFHPINLIKFKFNNELLTLSAVLQGLVLTADLRPVTIQLWSTRVFIHFICIFVNITSNAQWQF